MPTFRVYYKTRYRHLSEGGHHDFLADSEIEALRMFFSNRRTELEEEEESDHDLPDLSNLSLSKEYTWSEGEYLVELRGVEKVDLAACPLCNGEGEVDAALAVQFSGQQAR